MTERLTDKNFRLGFDDSNKLPSYEAIYERLRKYETAEEEGRLVVLPVGIEDEVYIIEKCENIPEELDGTLYDSDWGPGTATGYYCIYQDECPFDGEDFTDCDCYKQKYAIFKDFIGMIQVTYDDINIFSERICIPIVIGKNAFLTRGEAEKALKEMDGKQNE